MRKYTDAWEELRDSLKLEIIAPKYWHTRIHRGIRKEKYKDLAHSLWLAESKLIERIDYRTEGDRMIYNLIREKHIGLLDLFS